MLCLCTMRQARWLLPLSGQLGAHAALVRSSGCWKPGDLPPPTDKSERVVRGAKASHLLAFGEPTEHCTLLPISSYAHTASSPLIQTSHAHLSCAPVPDPLSLTPLSTPRPPHISFSSLHLTSLSHLSFTPLLHISHALLFVPTSHSHH